MIALNCIVFKFLLLPAEETNTNVILNPKVFEDASIGINLDVKIFNDFKLGLSVSSPYFFDGLICFRGEGDICMFQGIPNGLNTSASVNYYALKGGIVMTGSYPKDKIRPYGELGYLGVFPNTAVSNGMTQYNYEWGLYCLLGFDLLFSETIPYAFYVTVGANAILSDGLGTAERYHTTNDNESFDERPKFSNGFIITAGCRYYF